MYKNIIKDIKIIDTKIRLRTHIDILRLIIIITIIINEDKSIT